MAKVVFAIILLVLVLGGVIAFLYYLYEKPKQEEAVVQMFNLYLKFIDNSTNQEITTPFIIIKEGDSTITTVGEYIGEGFTKAALITNDSYIARNSGECFYASEYKTGFIEHPTDIRAIVRINPCGSIFVMQQGNLISRTNLSINVSTKGFVKNVGLCMTWSQNIITVSLENYTKVDTLPQRMETKAVKCYDLGKNFSSDSQMYTILYKPTEFLDSTDSITLWVIDGDTTPQSGGRVLWEDDNRRDFRISDYRYVLR